MPDNIDWDAILKAQSGDTSKDKSLRKPIMEAHERYIYHSEERSRKDSSDEKPKKREP